MLALIFVVKAGLSLLSGWVQRRRGLLYHTEVSAAPHLPQGVIMFRLALLLTLGHELYVQAGGCSVPVLRLLAQILCSF